MPFDQNMTEAGSLKPTRLQRPMLQYSLDARMSPWGAQHTADSHAAINP